ncbi:amino acid permease family protein [Kutzneria albida DSM 43870]|uniref:Amino acid permease family protein n=1 Tax=Kutzneria albida DSM 43870 TaxID=1449976 RepID=W5W3S8_9PSEU|nr:amino acid permease family protein [Kutzneria albida DSM 43870]
MDPNDGSTTVATSPTTARTSGLGVAHVVFFVIAASAPLTVAAGGIPQTFGVTATLGVPLLFLVLASLLAVFSAGYAAMSRRIVGAGAFYSYVCHGLGRTAGVGAAFVALLSYNTMQIGIYGLFGFTTADLLERKLGLAVPWWALVLGCVLLVGVLGYLRVDLNAKVLAVLLALESATVLVFDLSQFAAAPQPVSLAPFSWSALTGGSLGAAACFTMGAFTGFESAAIYGEECRDPRRTVARATYAAVGLIGVFYCLTAWAMISGTGMGAIVDRARAEGPSLVFTLAEHTLGGPFADLAQVFLVTSLFAALLSFHNAVARYFFALGREGVLPVALGRTHTRHGSPHVGSLTQTALAAVVVLVFALLGKDPVATLFTWFTNIGALGVLLLLAVTSVAVLAFFRRGGADGESRWHRAVAPAISAVALAAVFVTAVVNFDALLGSDSTSALRWVLPALVGLAAVGGVGYGWYLRLRRPAVHDRIGRG